MFQVKLKIHGGTTDTSGPSLCVSCKYATIVRGESMREEIVNCGQMNPPNDRIRFRVRECTKYLHASHATLAEMRDSAWILRTDPKRKSIGFVPYKDMSNKDKQDALVWVGDE